MLCSDMLCSERYELCTKLTIHILAGNCSVWVYNVGVVVEKLRTLLPSRASVHKWKLHTMPAGLHSCPAHGIPGLSPQQPADLGESYISKQRKAAS